MTKRILLGLLLWMLPSIALAAVTITQTFNQVNYNEVGGGTTISAAGLSTGTASGDRITTAIFSMYCDACVVSISSATINNGGGALSMTCVADAKITSGSQQQSIICWRLNTSGTDATFAVTLSAACSNCYGNLSIYAVTGADTTTPILSTATATDASGVPNASITIPASGALLAGSGGSHLNSAAGASWTNATLDQSLNTSVGTARLQLSTALSTSAGTATRTADWTGGIVLFGASLSLAAFQVSSGVVATNKSLMTLGVGQ